jgi:hypothetical protein
MSTTLSTATTTYLAQNPGPKPLPGQLGTFLNDLIGYTLTFLWIAAVVGVLGCAILMVVGRQGRNEVALRGLNGMLWVTGGLILGASAVTIVNTFITA